MVDVRVGERVLQLPEPVLSAGASYLQVANGEYVGLRGYADSVGLVLAALERSSALYFRF